jgi:signal transduction histidine kinase
VRWPGGSTAPRDETGTGLGSRAALWRALDVVRIAAALYAVAAFATRPDPYLHPTPGWLVLAALLVWSVLVAMLPRRSGWLVVCDLVIAVVAVAMTAVVDTPAVASRTNTLPLIWPAAAVMSWAVWRGWAAGVVAGLIVGLADMLVVEPITRRTLHNLVLLVMAGGTVGFATQLYERLRRQAAAGVAVAAAARERERLARDIHDSVLQVLAYVQRRGNEIGGEAGELGRMAGEQEVLLRALISGRDVGRASPGSAAGRSQAGEADVLTQLRALAGPRVEVNGPGGVVLLPVDPCRQLVHAVAACLDNVARHAGPSARAWVLVEDEPEAVTVSVRDDGPGFGPERERAAAEEGRLGLAQSIRGRLADAGGTVRVWSSPGQGVEVELRLPRGPGQA